MEISHSEENKEHEKNHDFIETGQPHEAMFLVLAYLPLFELLAMSEVCRSLREAVKTDILPWLNMVVEKPLNLRISDDILMRIISKAKGRLRTLVLINCVKITDDGLQWVVANNPYICKLHIPSCTSLTAEGVIRAVKTLTLNTHNLTSLKISGIYNINKEHIETLSLLLEVNKQQQRKENWLNFYPEYKQSTMRGEETNHPFIDVDICPKCDVVRKVFDCPKENCKREKGWALKECRGCTLCIPRCEECGKCIEFEEECEAACVDILCTDCWLQLPKCVFCNKPYCNQHASKQCPIPGSSRFVCDSCHANFILG